MDIITNGYKRKCPICRNTIYKGEKVLRVIEWDKFHIEKIYIYYCPFCAITKLEEQLHYIQEMVDECFEATLTPRSLIVKSLDSFKKDNTKDDIDNILEVL